MTLPACMRIEQHWEVVQMVSGAGWHVAVVKDREPEQYRVLFCSAKVSWRWRLSGPTRPPVATSILRNAQEKMHKGQAPVHALRTAMSLSKATMPKRFRERRKRLAERIEERQIGNNPAFGMF